DSDNIFVFGHSMGAFEAPYVAEGFDVKGIMGYGFLVDRWHDYNLGLITKQFPIIGTMSYAEAQDFADEARPVLYDFYFNKLSPGELDDKYGNGSEILTQAIDYDGKGYIYGRTYRFWQGLNDLNLVKAYSKLQVPVLAMYGEADIEALDKSSVEHLAYLLNQQQAGLGTFRFISGTDHAFIKVGTRRDGWLLKQSGGYGQHMAQNFNPEVVETAVEWMRSQTRE
ncbi:MAG: alpha/beta hydrolase, partial [Bacteroidota bacterium]